ncbi:MAG: methionine adenosyltransferase [Eubacteriales bacterium]|nr:methionine adenosyltransferase [Eubacteriales bacterium]
MYRIFTSESVTEGHPDKLCDQVSDAVLDAILAQDPASRVACETVAANGTMMIMGEITTKAQVDIEAIARRTVLDIGYDSAEKGFDGSSCEIILRVHTQSPDIAMGVDEALETRAQGSFDIGAGDQGMMFGYASDETAELMPAAIAFSHAVTRKLAEVRKSGRIPYLRPDGKAQVTVEYDEQGELKRVSTVVLSTQHAPEAPHEQIEKDMIEQVVLPAIPAGLIDENTRFLINPTGRFVVGGPEGDSGLTGRKIIVDTYGGYGHHGGGAFSGKDPTKVDRSAAYAARHAAKNLVAAGLAKKCEVGLAYAIGVAHPVSIFVDTFGTGAKSDEELAKLVEEKFDFRPAAIIERLQLRSPIYRATASYGHFGRTDVQLPWEKLDMVEELKK